jgi:hypothetical protein
MASQLRTRQPESLTRISGVILLEEKRKEFRLERTFATQNRDFRYGPTAAP